MMMSESNQWVMGETDGRFARIENDQGTHVARIDRVALGTNDEQWQSIVDTIAAAPEMVAVLQSVRRELRLMIVAIARYDVREQIDLLLSGIDAVLAKAEPVRTVKRRVNVTYELEIECSPEATASGLMAIAKRSAFIDATAAEAGIKVIDTEVSMVGELFED